ncbi:MAG: exodeoxyribonuclease VII large subunit, partial [Clostridia bacterium]|nr:exodeoxyribonuclease VII large subunit [Clostridia bacterium]
MQLNQSISVTELNSIIKSLLESEPFLNDIYVRGEISNFKAHSSGHMYFSLKDESSVIRSVMFRSSAIGLHFMPENGMRIIARGRVSAYVRDGQYQ